MAILSSKHKTVYVRGWVSEFMTWCESLCLKQNASSDPFPLEGVLKLWWKVRFTCKDTYPAAEACPDMCNKHAHRRPLLQKEKVTGKGRGRGKGEGERGRGRDGKGREEGRKGKGNVKYQKQIAMEILCRNSSGTLKVLGHHYSPKSIRTYFK